MNLGTQIVTQLATARQIKKLSFQSYKIRQVYTTCTTSKVEMTAARLPNFPNLICALCMHTAYLADQVGTGILVQNIQSMSSMVTTLPFCCLTGSSYTNCVDIELLLCILSVYHADAWSKDMSPLQCRWQCRFRDLVDMKTQNPLVQVKFRSPTKPH